LRGVGMGKKVAAVVAIAKKAPTAGRQNAGSGIGQKLTTLLGRRDFCKLGLDIWRRLLHSRRKMNGRQTNRKPNQSRLKIRNRV
jgi:hypothetical protein